MLRMWWRGVDSCIRRLRQLWKFERYFVRVIIWNECFQFWKTSLCFCWFCCYCCCCEVSLWGVAHRLYPMMLLLLNWWIEEPHSCCCWRQKKQWWHSWNTSCNLMPFDVDQMSQRSLVLPLPREHRALSSCQTPCLCAVLRSHCDIIYYGGAC